MFTTEIYLFLEMVVRLDLQDSEGFLEQPVLQDLKGEQVHIHTWMLVQRGCEQLNLVLIGQSCGTTEMPHLPDI